MATVRLYPAKVTQPNRNKASGLQGKCFSAVTRSGGTYEISCQDQRDPKYHHEWSNAEEILKGRTIQCGRPSTRMCSHETYYGIKGYRNTCPIAGVTGTYTQPATLRLFFNLTKNGITNTAKITRVKITFQHRCTGVDVADGSETISWGPNFDGAKVYPNRNALTIKLGNDTRIIKKNPPLSYNFSSIGTYTFKNVKYNDLINGIDIIYGNNLETNPGNIYLRGLYIDVEYEDGKPYIEATPKGKALYVSLVPDCRTTIKYILDVGYKQGTQKMSVKDAPKDLRDSIGYKTQSSRILVDFQKDNTDKNKRRVIATLRDETGTAMEKTVQFYLKGTNESISFKYNALLRGKPSITIPNQIQRNTKNTKITSIIVKNGCTRLIEVFDENLNNRIYKFENFDQSNTENIILKNDIDNFYKTLAGLSCGFHKLIFRFDGDKRQDQEKTIEITPTTHKFVITEISDEGNPNKELYEYKTVQNKSHNYKLLLKYIPTNDLINKPNFTISNSSHGKEVNNSPTKDIIPDISWENVGDTNVGYTKEITLGTYYPGKYDIQIKETECPANPKVFPFEITPKHKQYFDEIFVKGEDSTAFNYHYLVALEGDTITEPIFVDNIELGASYKDIKICTNKETENNIAGLGQIKTIDFTVSNTSNNDIENLLLELNVLIKNDDDIFEATTNEWLEADGIFYNFKENFEKVNSDYDFVEIKNLTSDDDEVDEENVYIYIKKINKQTSIPLKIPYGCNTEKEIYLQVLLFEQPMKLYEYPNCNIEQNTFDLIPLRVYDSILTDISIEGETDLFFTQIDGQCPKECFNTNLTYKIKNIDSNTLIDPAQTVIENDPRLVPYKVVYEGREYTKDNLPDNIIINILPKSYRQTMVSDEKIHLYLKLENHDEIHLYQNTNASGEAIIFVTIPETYGGTYTISELLKYMSIEYLGSYFYTNTSKVGDEYSGETRYPKKKVGINPTTIEVIDDQFEYTAGQVIPLKIKLIGQIQYYKNEIKFKPKINKPGSSDKLTVFYKICNLDKNEGILTTKFKTLPYVLYPNEITKKIYCGIKTDLELNTKLTKVIVENKTLNRLSLALVNKKRDNKDVQVIILENMDIEKYDIFDYKIDKGRFYIEGRRIIWEVDYLDEDSVVRGYIDFKAKEIGYSILNSSVTDFIDNMRNPVPKFGEDSYKCECRKEM